MSDKNDKKTVAPAIEFQPDALEIQQSRLPFFARFTPYAAFVMMAGAIIWACIGKVDTVVQAPARLVSDQQNIVMRPRETAVIKSIDVKVGDIVKPNQILVTFDPQMYDTEKARLTSEISTLSAQFDRLYAEFNQKEYVPASSNKDTAWQLEIHRQRMGYFREKENYYEQERKRIESTIRSRKTSLTNNERRLKEYKQIEKMYLDLGDVVSSKREMIEIKVKTMEMESQADELRNSLDELEHQKQSSIASRNAFLEEWRNSISTEMIRVRRELISNMKQMEKTTQMAEYIYLRAPCEAVVHEIAAISPGTTTREAEALVTLVPLNGLIELETEISPQDIGKVSLGADVRVKINAFPFQKHGTLNGRINVISENTFTRQPGEMRSPDSTPTYYKARAGLSGSLRNVDEKFRLIPGMEAQAEIKVGERRVIEFIIYPLIKAFDEAAREP